MMYFENLYKLIDKYDRNKIEIHFVDIYGGRGYEFIPTEESNFKALISVLNAVEDYDQVFITTVDHESLVNALNGINGISVVKSI